MPVITRIKRLKIAMAKTGMPVYNSVEDYIANQTEEAQSVLTTLRAIIQDSVPEAVEQNPSKVPTFNIEVGGKPKALLMIAAYKKYVSFYPHQAAVDHFKDELAKYDLGKGTLKLGFDEEIPEELIKKLIEYRKREVLEK
ncbi:MAG: DUF1801 domain-containing protein [Bacteroidota bacterium]